MNIEERSVGSTRFLLPANSQVIKEGVDWYATSSDKPRDHMVLGARFDPTIIDQFVSVQDIGDLYHLVHQQKVDGLLMPHNLHTQEAEAHHRPYREYVQDVTFAKVTGEMIHPVTGETVPCAVLNLRMPRETYGGQLWWVIGGHNVAHDNEASSLRRTLVMESEEEANVIDANGVERPFTPRERSDRMLTRVAGYGSSKDRIGRVHRSTVVGVHLHPGQHLGVRDRQESVGFVSVPLAEWMRFMEHEGKISNADKDAIRVAIIQGLQQEVYRIPEADEREARHALINDQLNRFFGSENKYGRRNEWKLSYKNHTPPIDKLSIRAMRDIYQEWGLL